MSDDAKPFEIHASEAELDDLRRQVAQNFDFQRKARLLANLDEIGDDVTEVGVGGPDYAGIRAISHLDPESRQRLLGTHADIGKLVRQAELQRSSYTEIINSLETTDETLRTTPWRCCCRPTSRPQVPRPRTRCR